MLSRADNELVTRVCGDAPLGRMLRAHFWIPAVVTSKLVAGGAPARVRLLGDDYVAFRSAGGGVRFLDAVCQYPVHEAAGVVWAYLGAGEPPPFHQFAFAQLPAPSHVYATQQAGHFNWLQAVETTMDSAHLGILHASSIAPATDIALTKAYVAPVYDVERMPWGFRYASIRALNDGRSYVRVNTFVAPWFSIISPSISGVPGGTVQFTVPADDEHSTFFFLQYRTDGLERSASALLAGCTDPTNWPPPVPGGPDERWGQDRAAMDAGHTTGFPQHLLTEDLAVVTSMKPIVDRTKEQLNAADAAIVNVRRSVLDAIGEFARGETPACARIAPEVEAQIVPQSDFVPAGTSWREHFLRETVGAQT